MSQSFTPQAGKVTWPCGCTQDPVAHVTEYTHRCEAHTPDLQTLAGEVHRQHRLLEEAAAALHVALRFADGTLDEVEASRRSEELAGCQDVLTRLAEETQ